MRIRQFRTTIAVVIVLGALAGAYLVVPWLGDLTGGAFAVRWTDIQTTGRDDLMSQDLEVFRSNWALGVGTGHVSSSRPSGSTLGAHTEFTRLLAEHGLFGVLALVLLSLVMFENIRRARDPLSRGVVATLIVWSFLYMTVSAMRTVAPAYLFGLATSTFLFTTPATRKGGSPWPAQRLV